MEEKARNKKTREKKAVWKHLLLSWKFRVGRGLYSRKIQRAKDKITLSNRESPVDRTFHSNSPREGIPGISFGGAFRKFSRSLLIGTGPHRR